MPSKGRFGGILALVTALLAGGACSWWHSAPPPGVAARVNGYQITTLDLDRAVATQTAGASRPLPPQQLQQLRLGLLSQLIDREIVLQYAAHLGIVPTPADIASQLAIEKIKQPDEAEDLLRRQVTEQWTLSQVFAREVDAKIAITDGDIDAYYNANRSMFNVTEPRYHLEEILVTAQPAPVTNLAGDKAADRPQARAKLRMLEQKLRQGADFSALAQEYSEDPNTAGSGGDLGLVPESALQTQIPAPLRQAIMLLQPGQVSPPIATPGGYYLVKLVDRQTPGQKPASDQQVRAEIRDILVRQRAVILRTALISVLRNRAQVENYLAEDLLAQSGVTPATR